MFRNDHSCMKEENGGYSLAGSIVICRREERNECAYLLFRLKNLPRPCASLTSVYYNMEKGKSAPLRWVCTAHDVDPMAERRRTRVSARTNATMYAWCFQANNTTFSVEILFFEREDEINSSA